MSVGLLDAIDVLFIQAAQRAHSMREMREQRFCETRACEADEKRSLGGLPGRDSCDRGSRVPKV